MSRSQKGTRLRVRAYQLEVRALSKRHHQHHQHTAQVVLRPESVQEDAFKGICSGASNRFLPFGRKTRRLQSSISFVVASPAEKYWARSYKSHLWDTAVVVVDNKEESLSQQSGRLGWELLQCQFNVLGIKRTYLVKLFFTRAHHVQISKKIVHETLSGHVRKWHS